MLARKALLHVHHLSVDLYRRFPFQIANRHSDTQLRRCSQHNERWVHREGGSSILRKLSGARGVGYLKGKSAIQIHGEVVNVKQGFTGNHFWSRGYCISTVVWMSR